MDLLHYREQIDDIDNELLQLFKNRMSVARQIALYKKVNNLPTLDAARETEKLAAIDDKADDEELRPYVRKLYAFLFEISREYQDGIIT